MEKYVKAVQLTLFDIFSYILPGIFLISILFLFYSSTGLKFIADNPIPILFVSYILGHILHLINGVPQELIWFIYHQLKEKDGNGRGVQNPTKNLGKFAKWLRYTFLEESEDQRPESHLKDAANNLLNEYYNEEKLTSYDWFYIKENIFYRNKISIKYEFLHYLKIFCRSIAFSLLICAISTAMTAVLSDLTFHISPDYIIDFNYIAVIFFLICVVLSLTFYKQGNFYKKYRDNALNAETYLYIKEKHNGNT